MFLTEYNEEETLKKQRVEARAEGIEEGKVESIKNIMETLKLTAQQAMDALKIPAADQAKYMARL